jgi:RNA polymerase sigma-70 factor (ECF subfamily)
VVAVAVPGEDATLLRAVCTGDEAALKALYERHATWLYVRLLRRCNDEDLVDDVLQDTFLAVWRGAKNWRGDGRGGRLDLGNRSAPTHLTPASQQGADPVPADQVDASTDHVASAEEAVLLGVEHGDIAGALSRLSPEVRSVVQATLLDGLTTREAATLLGLPQGT